MSADEDYHRRIIDVVCPEDPRETHQGYSFEVAMIHMAHGSGSLATQYALFTEQTAHSTGATKDEIVVLCYEEPIAGSEDARYSATAPASEASSAHPAWNGCRPRSP